MKKIDLKDRKILYQLDINSRQPNSEIAKKVGLSKDVVNYRIKKLEQTGIIQGYYALVDFSKLGYFSARVYLKLIDCSIQKEKEIIDFLINNKVVFYVAKIDGSYDLGFSTLTKNAMTFEEFYLSFKKKFKQFMSHDKFSIFTKVHHFHKAYLLDKKQDDVEPEVFGTHDPISVDELDINILKVLANNAKIPLIELAKKLKKPPRTIAFRIKQLEKKKLIYGYKFRFNFTSIGYKYYKLDLTLKDVSRLNELKQYSWQHPNIMYVDGNIGGYDFEVDVEIKSQKKFLKLVEDLRNKFPEIREWNYWVLRKYFHLSYFPSV